MYFRVYFCTISMFNWGNPVVNSIARPQALPVGTRSPSPKSAQSISPAIAILMTSTLCLGLFAISSIPAVNHALVAMDRTSAYTLNVFIGKNRLLDLALSWLNTKAGDVIVLSVTGAIFAFHCFYKTTLEEAAKRAAFWTYIAFWCLSTYLIVCNVMDELTPRPTPLTALNLHNVQALYNVHLHSSALHSFPSGHALAYMMFAIASSKRYPGMCVTFTILGVVMLSIRLILGMHWVSDMILGSLPLSLLVISVALQPFALKLRAFLERIGYVTLSELASRGLPILKDKV